MRDELKEGERGKASFLLPLCGGRMPNIDLSISSFTCCNVSSSRGEGCGVRWNAIIRVLHLLSCVRNGWLMGLSSR